MKKMVTALLVTSAMVLVTGCSTIFKGTTQVVTITSDPSNADVLVDGNNMGKTPLSVSLKKNAYTSMTVKKSGYNSQIKALQKTYDPVTLINVFWDLSTTDLISGAAYEYQPNTYHFALEKEEVTEEAPKSKKNK